MSSNFNFRALGAPLCALLLCACGGGGGDDGASATDAHPTSGTYAWVLKAEGQTSAIRYGLSLVHPQTPTIEDLVEPVSAAVTEARVVSSGTVDVAGLRVGSLQPYALFYVVGGDVRRVPLVANGSAPSGRVQRAGTTSACSILIDAVDHAAPEQSRFILSTAGTDGTCGTADDGRAEARFDAVQGVVFTPLSSNLPLSLLRDPATLAPRGWVSARNAAFFGAAPGSSLTLRATGTPAIDRVVGSSFRSVVAESSAGLALLDFPGGDVFTDTPVPGISTTGWQYAGHDADSHYVWRNSGSGFLTSWQVLRITRQAPVTVTQSGGSGEIALATLGTGKIYLTVLGAFTNQLVAIDKAPLGAPVVLESLGTTGVATVSTSGAGLHQLWRVTGVGSATPTYELEIIDEQFNKIYTAAAGGFPMALGEGSTLDFARSESRSRFIFATGYNARAFGDAALVSYDAAAGTATSLGTLPGTAVYGPDLVFANVVTSPSNRGAGFANRSVSGVLQTGGARVFSYDTSVAGSLTLTTSTR